MNRLLRDGVINTRKEQGSQSKDIDVLQQQFANTLYAEYRDLKYGICTSNLDTIKHSIVELFQLKRDASLYKSFTISTRLHRVLAEVEKVIDEYDLDRDELDYLRLHKQVMYGGYTQGTQFSSN